MLASSKSSTDLSSLASGYSLCAQTEGKSTNTVAIVTNTVTYLNDFLSSEGLSTDVTQISIKEIRAFIAHLQLKRCFSNHPYTKAQQRGLSGHTINTYMRSIRAFWSWLVEEEHNRFYPIFQTEDTKAARKVITPFTEEQIQNLLKAIDTSSTTGLMNYTIVLTLLDTGMRLGKLIGLKMNDVDLRNRTLKVFGKGAKERRLPIGKRLLAALWQYQVYRPQAANDRALISGGFEGIRGVSGV